MLQHAVLMDAGFMGEGIGADDGLVRLHGEAGDGGDEARGFGDHRAVDAGVKWHQIGTRAQRHDDLFHRGVAGALAETVDSAFDLTRAGADGRQRIGNGEAQIVVAMNRDDRLVDVGHAVEQHLDEGRELLRHRIAQRIGNVDGASTGLDCRFHTAAEEIMIAA